MPSSPDTPPPTAQLVDLLARAGDGTRMGAIELAELLWLARHIQAPADPEPPPVADPDPDPVAPLTSPPAGPSVTAPSPTSPTSPPPPALPHDEGRVPLHLPAPAPGAEGAGLGGTVARASLLAPAPPMLARPLALQRALRPLARRVPSPLGRELDEEATADRIARLGAGPEWWLPVLRPTRERWLRLHLVYDAGPTMPVWRPLVRELHTAFAQSGAFRTVELYRADADGTVRGPLGAPAPVPADGRTVTLLISDCMGPQWWDGPAGARWYGTLRRWAARLPLAVLQPLPERLWRGTALPTEAGLLTAPGPAAPSAALTFTPYDPVPTDTTGPGSPAARTDGTLPLPVLEPSPVWLAHWSALIADPGGAQLPGAVARLPRRPLPFAADDPTREDVTALSATELVGRFRATASPEAFRLAGHLALGVPRLPVMRLVHAAIEPRPRPQHLAEVILSGMLTSEAPHGSYAFRPGVRGLLKRSLPRSSRDRTAALLAEVGALIDARAGTAAGDFRAEAPAVGGTPGNLAGAPIATVDPESVREMAGTGAGARPPGELIGGRYRLEQRLRPSGTLWLARDTEAEEDTDRTVVVRLHTRFGPERTERFRRAATALTRLRHPNVVTVLDHGVHGDVPYVVMEHVTGIPLNALAAPSGYLLPPRLLVSVASGLARAVEAVHARGVTHGSIGMTRVILLPDGTAKLTHFDVGHTTGTAGRAEDERALGQLLMSLASGGARRDLSVGDSRPSALPPHLFEPFIRAIAAAHDGEPEGLARLQDPELPRLAEESPSLWYSLLGPVRVWRSGPEPEPAVLDRHTATELRPLMCQLLLRHGTPVTQRELLDGIWGSQRPPHAEAELGRLASRLRTALGPGTVATLPDGYALHASTAEVDVVACDVLVARAKEAREREEPAEARELIGSALDLWRGEPLDGVSGPAAQSARTRLRQLRLWLLRTRAELDLELGRLEEAASDLVGLLADHPSREDFWRLRMVALQRLGRIAEALDAYEEFQLLGGPTVPAIEELHRELLETLEAEEATRAAESRTTGHSPPLPETTDPDEDSASPANFAWGETTPPSETPEPNESAAPPGDTTPPESTDPGEVTDPSAFREGTAPDEGIEPSEGTTTSQATSPNESTTPPESTTPREATEPTEPTESTASPEGAAPSNPTRTRASVVFEFADEEPEFTLGEEAAAELAHALGRVVARLIEESGVDPNAVERISRLSGFALFTEVDVDVLPLLRTVLARLTDLLAEEELPRLRVTFWHTVRLTDTNLPGYRTLQSRLESALAGALVGISRPFHEQLMASGDDTAAEFQPLYRQPDDPEPTCWYALLGHERPGQAHAPVHWAEVQLSLRAGGPKAFTCYAKLDWRFNDPDAHTPFEPVELPQLLIHRLRREALDVTRRLPSERVGEAQGRLRDRLLRLAPPGVSLRGRTSLTPGLTTPTRPWTPGSPVADALTAVDSLILGFDGPVTQLYSRDQAMSAARELAAILVEYRDPSAALDGVPLIDPGIEGTEGSVHPLDVLRRFAEHATAEDLRRRLDAIEARATRNTRPSVRLRELLGVLNGQGIQVAVVGDTSQEAMNQVLGHRDTALALRAGGIHGRTDDLGLLMPDPDCLRRALSRLGTRPDRCVMVAGSVAEATAARSIGLPFVGLARFEADRQRLMAAGAMDTVNSLDPLVKAASTY
ncbi:SAV_2336 N-terminal domain-related protein [Streptomyces sp. NPDC058001]|uniref:SAV_2336 N-terminal domain-related protein n=1 Tax=Streptomyces sp. NPDC058001 TaxID=3346300 RepID=UPI0036EA32BA